MWSHGRTDIPQDAFLAKLDVLLDFLEVVRNDGLVSRGYLLASPLVRIQ